MSDKPVLFHKPTGPQRVHADGSPCKHKVNSLCRPLPGQDCPGPVGFVSTCRTPECDWKAGPLMKVVIDQQYRRTHARVVVVQEEATGQEAGG